MRKNVIFFIIIAIGLFGLSCNKGKSYTDMLNEQKDAINFLIDKENIEVLKHYPEDGIFEENQFVLLENGVYLNVIDPGTEQRAVSGKTRILYRCIVSYPKDSAYAASSPYYPYFNQKEVKCINYGPSSNGTDPYPLFYGDYASSSNLAGEGIQTPLKYVGHGAKVKLIVPFKCGLYIDQSNYQPAYYEIIQYKFHENL